MMDTKLYSPLDISSKEIRLLTLHPGRKPSLIRISLSAARLSDDPPSDYEALSYEWGPADGPMHTITVNGKPFQVRENLWQTLRHLRSETEDHVFWIDAICINQKDVPERNSQVPLMGEVYSKAALVKVWLGAGDEEVEHALRDIEKAYVDARWRFFSPGEDKPHIQELCELVCSQTYWTRIWVVQEFVLAKELLLCYGSVQVALHPFHQALVRLILSNLKHNPAKFEAIRNLHAYQMLEHRSRATAHNGYELAALLTKYKNFKATELKDLVYALLGLATDIGTCGINVDYNSSFLEFLLEVSRYLHAKSPSNKSPDLSTLLDIIRNHRKESDSEEVDESFMKLFTDRKDS